MVISFAIWQRLPGYSSAEGLLNWNGGAGTDWQKELYNSAMVSKVSLNVSGGNKTSTYNLSGSYLNQDGIVNTTVMRHGTFVLRILFLFSIIICVWGLR